VRSPIPAGGDRRLAEFAARIVAAGAASAALGMVWREPEDRGPAAASEPLEPATESDAEAAPAAGREEIGWAGWECEAEERPASRRTSFDLASLTKPFMASLALALDRQALLPLDLPVAEVWPSAAPALAARPLAALLRHRSGLQAWTPLFALCRARGEARGLLTAGSLLGARRGTYSDLGFILWGMAAEAWLRAGLGTLLHEHLLAPLGTPEVMPVPGDREGIAECRLDGRREAHLAAAQGIAIPPAPPPPPGLPQDGNARFLGGLGGHAGLFAPADAVVRLAREWLRPRAVLTPGAVAAALAGGGRFALGWRRAGGGTLGRAAYGHQGFTGGDLWILPDRGEVLLLLAHRRDPLRSFQPWRRRFGRVARAAEVSRGA
jgi:CubicO group peptidase (beta-lactamase class C family)